MVDALAPFLDRLGDRSIRPRAFQQFDLVRAHLEEGSDHPFALDSFAFVARCAQKFRVEFLRRCQLLYCDADVFDADHGSKRKRPILGAGTGR